MVTAVTVVIAGHQSCIGWKCRLCKKPLFVRKRLQKYDIRDRCLIKFPHLFSLASSGTGSSKELLAATSGLSSTSSSAAAAAAAMSLVRGGFSPYYNPGTTTAQASSRGLHQHHQVKLTTFLTGSKKTKRVGLDLPGGLSKSPQKI